MRNEYSFVGGIRDCIPNEAAGFNPTALISFGYWSRIWDRDPPMAGFRKLNKPYTI
jgi:hypothetical protein